MQKDIITNLQKWAVQPSGTSGYQIPYEFGFEVLTTLYPEVVIGADGAWPVMEVASNVFNFPRAKRNNSSDIKRNIQLGTEMQFDYTSGEFDNVLLDNQLAIAQIFQNFEIADTNADFIGFRIQEAVRQVAREYEDIAVKDLTAKGTAFPEASYVYQKDSSGAVQSGAAVDVYETILNLRTIMLENGSDIRNIDIYCTPGVVAQIMKDKHYIANGIGNIPASEVRMGFAGTILGFNVYEAGRLTKINESLDSDHKCTLLAVDRSQVILCRRMVQPVVMERAPSTYPAECSLLKCLEYIKHYVVNPEGIYYLNMSKTAA